MAALSKFVRRYEGLRKPVRVFGVIFIAFLSFWKYYDTISARESAFGEGVEALSLCMVVFGYTIRALANGFRKGVLPSSEPILVTGGMYSYVRHPLYLANILIILGILLLCQSLYIFLIMGTLTILVFLIVILEEERQLGALFGSQYRLYASNTPMIFPIFKGRRHERPAPFAVKAAIREMVKMLFVMVLMLGSDAIIVGLQSHLST